jgi:hypothetical protein
MKAYMHALVAALLAAQFSMAAPTLPPPNPGFERLKTLVGDWKGTATGGGSVQSSYKLVAGGSAIEEHLSHEDMVTLYHLDGKRLMLTHYCAAQNQPRMRAAAYKEGDNVLKFAFFDATNMPDKFATHMHDVTFTFHDKDHFTQEWTMYQDGKPTMKVTMDLERVK